VTCTACAQSWRHGTVHHVPVLPRTTRVLVPPTIESPTLDVRAAAMGTASAPANSTMEATIIGACTSLTASTSMAIHVEEDKSVTVVEAGSIALR
jgi:hypothetical protein